MTKFEVYLKPIHQYGYRYFYGTYPRIAGLYNLVHNNKTRLCYEVIYDDGVIDYVALESIELGHYEIVNYSKGE